MTKKSNDPKKQKLPLTEQHRQQARRLLAIFGVLKPTDEQVKALAAELDMLHEDAVRCAVVRFEREERNRQEGRPEWTLPAL